MIRKKLVRTYQVFDNFYHITFAELRINFEEKILTEKSGQTK